jgi:outer membrane protein assembly factor BamB
VIDVIEDVGGKRLMSFKRTVIADLDEFPAVGIDLRESRTSQEQGEQKLTPGSTHPTAFLLQEKRTRKRFDAPLEAEDKPYLKVDRKRRKPPTCEALMRRDWKVRVAVGGLTLQALIGSAVQEPFKLTNAWTVAIASAVDSSPALAADGTIYFGTFDGKLRALTPDGARKWVFRTGREIHSSPAIGTDGTVYFGSRDQKLYAVQGDGKKAWEFVTGGWVDSSPALGSDGTVYCGSWDRSFYAIQPNGAKKWQFNTEGEITSSAAIDTDGAVYFGSYDKKLYALDASGAKKWEFATQGAVISSPALDSRGIYFTSVDGFLYALNPDGSLRWKLHTGGVYDSSPVVGPDGTIFVGANTNLWSVTPEGKKLWERDAGGVMDNSATVLANDELLFISRQGQILGIGRDRFLRWEYYVYGQGYSSPAVGPEGDIYLPTHVGPSPSLDFSRFRGVAPLAKSAWPKFRGNPRNTGNLKDNPS